MNEPHPFDLVLRLLSRARFSTLERQLLTLVIEAEAAGVDANQLAQNYKERWGPVPHAFDAVVQDLISASLLVEERRPTGSVLRVDPNSFTRATEERLYRNLAEDLELARRVRDLSIERQFEEYYGKPNVIQGFMKIEQSILNRGGNMYDLRDILPFVADTEDGLRLRHAGTVDEAGIEADCYRLRRRHELFASGKLRMTLLLDQIQTEEVLTRWSDRWGSDYVASRIAKFIELLDLDPFVVIFIKERIDLKLQIIEGHCAALYWRSIPQGETDRLIAFWQPSMILSFLQYFWTCYHTALRSRDVSSAEAEVRAWAEAQLRSI